ncbi:hypothetical protein CRYUN_Cryun03dG0108100 [Craigia yunnanensis]
MINFRKVIEECELNEMLMEGPRLTWLKGSGSNVIYERLDRGLCSKEWLEKFLHPLEEHLMATTSDHLPICFHVRQH